MNIHDNEFYISKSRNYRIHLIPLVHPFRKTAYDRLLLSIDDKSFCDNSFFLLLLLLSYTQPIMILISTLSRKDWPFIRQWNTLCDGLNRSSMMRSLMNNATLSRSFVLALYKKIFFTIQFHQVWAELMNLGVYLKNLCILRRLLFFTYLVLISKQYNEVWWIQLFIQFNQLRILIIITWFSRDLYVRLNENF